MFNSLPKVGSILCKFGSECLFGEAVGDVERLGWDEGRRTELL